VDISGFADKRISADSNYVSQFGPGWNKYNPSPSEEEMKAMRALILERIRTRDGKPIEGFRYYRGLPDAIGK